MPVHEFRNTDPGASVLSGTVGALLGILDTTLIIGRLFTTADDAAFNDHSVEARSEGGTPFTLFPTPGTSDRAYFGAQVTFSRITFDLAVVGAGGSYQWEYRRNDATWQPLTVTDGTAGFTQSGTVTFTPPANWGTVSVNSVTMYYVRVRPTGAPSTNPTVNYVSIFGWTRPFSGTNKAVYRSLTGARLYYRVQDDGPGTHGGREARLRGFETMTDVDTGGGGFPTTAQLAAGIIPRKSSTADATARNWRIVADDRTFKWYFATGDNPIVYAAGYAGEIYSFVSGDLYNGMVIGKHSEGSTSPGELDSLATFTTTIIGHYVCRAYTGVGTSLDVGKHGDRVAGSTTILLGTMQYPNGPDGGLHIAPVWVHEIAGPSRRGLLRGFWHYLHPLGATSDDDTFDGVGDFAGKRFRIIKQGTNGSYVEEISDTWRTN
jgi:hypothetical protein